MRTRRTRNLLTIAISVAAYLLLSSNLSWGATTVYVYQAASTGALTIKPITCDGVPLTPTQTVTMPYSCSTPDLFWDADVTALRLNGFDSNNNPSWTGTIDASGVFKTTMANLPVVPCTSAPASVVSAAFPETITIASVPPCTGWNYGLWTPASCAAGSIQTRTATGTPSGCVGGFPTQPTVQSCPPQTCSSWTYTCAGTCSATTSTCPALVTSSSPAGCTGGNPLSTISCNPTATTCTSWTYSAWSPSETSCTSGQTLTRTITGSSPAGCQGGTPAPLSEACPIVSPGSVIPLTYNKANVYYPVPAGGTRVFSASVASPQCTSTSNLYVSIAAQQSSPKVDLFLRKSNGTATLPTIDDYNYLKGKTGSSSGLLYDSTSRGTFFWNGFVGDGSGETVKVVPSNLVRMGVTGFNVLDTYYIMLVNTSSTPSNQVYIQYYCF